MRITHFATALGLLLLGSCTDKTASLDAYFEEHIASNHIPGAVIHVSDTAGNLLYEKAYGKASEDRELTINSLFRLASMTKALTAVSVLQLQEQGLLNTKDPVKKYLPYFDQMMVMDAVNADSTFVAHPSQTDITIQHLLTHTGGLGYGFQDDDYNKMVLHYDISEGFCPDDRTAEENTRKIASIPLMAEPGTTYIYSLSYEVLSAIIEKVSGQRFDQYVIEHILNPIGMEDSYFIVPKAKRDRLVAVYMPQGEALVYTDYPYVDYPIIENRQFFTGGSDLIATAKDYDKFLQMLVNRGTYNNQEILKPTSVEQMLSKQTDLGEGDSYQGYAAWMTNSKGAANGLTSEGTYGFGGFFDTYCWVDEQKGIKATLFLQMYPTNEHQVHEGFEKIVYETYF